MEPIDSGLHAAGLTEFLVPLAEVGSDLGPGSRLGDVTIVRLVAEGGMGRVYEALQGMPCRTVAVKVIRPGVLTPAAARRFEHEAQILGRLTHPGIARIYSVGMQTLAGGAVPYFVMEYVEDARSITAYANERDLGTRDRVVLFREACRAVAHGHQKGVIHRDLKPGNILVDAAGHPKVIDFGVARSTDADVTRATMLTDAGQLVGTLQYMSPEQFDGELDEIDVRADVYALGVVLYELLTGKPPYDVARRPVYEAARIVHETEPRSLATVNPGLRGDLATIVAKCLEKDRIRRYSSAAELEADLGRFLRGEPIAASPPGLVDGLLRLARRHRLAAGAAVAVTSTFVAATIGISIFAVQAERERRSAVAERERANDASRVATERLYVANLRSLQAALDSRNTRLARRLFADNLAITGSPPPLEMRLLGAGLDDALAVLDLERSAVETIRYSPDGGVLAAIAGELPSIPDDQVGPVVRRSMFANLHWTMDFSDGRRASFFKCSGAGAYEPLAPPDAAWVWQWRAERGDMTPFEGPMHGHGVVLAVTADGGRVAAHAGDGTVHLVDAGTGHVQAMVEGHRGRVGKAFFTGDGSRLVLQVPRGSLGLWDASNGLPVVGNHLAEEGTDVFLVSPDGARLAVVDRLPIGSADGARRTIRLHATADGRELAAITLPSVAQVSATTMAFSPDGSRLVTASDDGELRVWDTDTGSEIARLRGHTATVTAVAYSPDGGQVATGAANGAIRLWDARTGAADRELLAHDSAVMTLAFQPDGTQLASGSHDGTVRIWPRAGRQRLADISGPAGITAAAFSPDGSLLAIAPRGGGTVEIWDPRTAERQFVLDAAGAVVKRIVFAPLGGRIAAVLETPAGEPDVRVWSVLDGGLVAGIGPHERGVAAAAFSPDGDRLLTTTATGGVRLWEAASGRRLLEFARPDARMRHADAGAAFGDGGTKIVSALPEILDVATGAVVGELPSRGNVTVVAMSPDGQLVASGVASGTVYLNRLGRERAVSMKLAGHSRPVRAVVFDADGTRLVTASDDGTARLWDTRKASELQVFNGHEAPVAAVGITPDGSRVVTGSRDGTVRVWDAASGFEVCRLSGQADSPESVALSPDGALLVTATPQGVARIQGLSNADVTRARSAGVAAQARPAPRETPRGRPDPDG